MTEKMVQGTLFDGGSGSIPAPRTANQWAYRAAKIAEELKIGQWDYDRLRPDMNIYEERVKKWRGVKKFEYKSHEFEAIEARAVVRFLKGWEERKGRLERDLAEAHAEIKKLVE